jgi:putative methyltransferase (TIGR04325 family)
MPFFLKIQNLANSFLKLPCAPSNIKKPIEVFTGDYATWEDASSQCSGYAADVIFEKTKAAAMAVKQGQALFERDSVLFHEEFYAWQMLACLNAIAASNEGRLSVLDFGGSLGSSYFQHRKILQMLPSLSWTVVEQAHYVDFGSKNFEDCFLKFLPTIPEAIEASQPNVVLFGSVLSYLPNPFEVLQRVISSSIDAIIVDRTAFLEGNKDRLTIQKVSPHIYDASYPARFFSLPKFKGFMSAAGFELISEWISFDDYRLTGELTSSKGFLFVRIAS